MNNSSICNLIQPLLMHFQSTVGQTFWKLFPQEECCQHKASLELPVQGIPRHWRLQWDIFAKNYLYMQSQPHVALFIHAIPTPRIVGPISYIIWCYTSLHKKWNSTGLHVYENDWVVIQKKFTQASPSLFSYFLLMDIKNWLSNAAWQTE